MPAQQRFPTKYPGVHYIHGKWGDGKKQKIFLIRYRKNGIAIEKKVGRQREDGMTEAKASRIRAHRMSGTEPTNAEEGLVKSMETDGRLEGSGPNTS